MINIFSPGVEFQWYQVLTDVSRENFVYSDYSGVIDLSFATDKKTYNFQRSVYNLLDYVGDVGGLMDGLKLFASILIAPISSYNFNFSLLTNLFKVEGSTGHQNELEKS